MMELRKKKADGMIVRSREKWIYMKVNRIENTLVILRKRCSLHAMCFIQKDNGDIIHDSNLITQEAKTFYEKWYTSSENYVVYFNIGNIDTPTLSQ